MKKNFLFLLSTVIVLTFISCNHENGNNNQTLEVEIIHNAVTDFDGNSYDAVRIGNQVWMQRNLSTTHYKDGTPVEQGIVGDTLTFGQPLYYDADMNSNDIYYDPNLKGLYYNWYAANNAHGLCPEGWHVPSSDDWETLMKYVYENATTKSTTKALASREGWPSSNQEGTPGCQPEANNETGFSAFPVGWIDFIDYFDETGNCIYSTSQLSDYGGVAYFWSTYRDNYIGGNYYSIDFTKRDYTVGLNTEEHALSVRCLKN